MWRWLLYCTPHSLRLDLKQAHRPHWRRWGKPSGPCPPKLRHILPFVACEAVSQSKCCCSLKVKVFGPPKHFGAGYAIDRSCRKEFHLFSMWFHAVWRKELLRFKEPMRENKFECFLLVMHDKIVHNPKICLELSAIQWPPFDSVTIYRSLVWSNWPLGVDFDHFKNHWFKVSSMRIDCHTLLRHNNALSKILGRKVLHLLSCRAVVIIGCGFADTQLFSHFCRLSGPNMCKFF